MKARTLQVCCTNIAVPDGVSDCCSMHSFNTTELIKLRNVYYLSNFSPSQSNLRNQEIQTNLFLYSNIHAHTMNMHLLSLYSILGHIFHHRTHLLSFSCLFFPLLPLFFSLFFLPLFVFFTQTIFPYCTINSTMQIFFRQYFNMSM